MVKRVWVITLASLALLVGTALAKGFEEGLHYLPIKPTPPVGTGDKIEVVEFFWYGCHHCRDFEPTVTRWAQALPPHVEFQQMPVLFGGAADLHAQVFYALQGIGELDRLHHKIFDTIHVENQKLRSREEVDALLAANGVDMAAFAESMNSFGVAAKVNRARALMRRYGIRGVPSMVVDGRYKSGSGFADFDEMIEVIDHVVDKVANQRRAQTDP